MTNLSRVNRISLVYLEINLYYGGPEDSLQRFQNAIPVCGSTDAKDYYPSTVNIIPSAI